MGFVKSTSYPTLQDMLLSCFYPGDEEIEDIADLAQRLKADNPADYISSLSADIMRFLQAAGDRSDEYFLKEFLSYFAAST